MRRERKSDASRAAVLTVNPREIRKHVLTHVGCNDEEAWKTVIVTAVLHVASFLLFPFLDWRIWMTVRGLILVRTFVVFHDCCHGSLFRSGNRNYFVGKICGAIVVTPFEKWRRDHLHHHHIYGQDGVQDSALTVRWTEKEWEAFPIWLKAIFRVTRDPFIFLFVAPLCKFGIHYRFAGGGGALFTNIYKCVELLSLYWMLGAAWLRVEILAM
eukprot:3040458-Rhodomonas_salina.1